MCVISDPGLGIVRASRRSTPALEPLRQWILGRPEWLTTVSFDETQAGTLVTHIIQHKTREVRDAHLQAGMQEGTVQTLTRLNEHTAAMEQVAVIE